MGCDGGEEGHGGASAAAETRGMAAVLAVPATGAGEEGNSGESLRAAQVTKRLGEKPRSKRATRGIRGKFASTLSHAGIAHPPGWVSAGRRRVGTAGDGGCWCGGGSGASPEVQGR